MNLLGRIKNNRIKKRMQGLYVLLDRPVTIDKYSQHILHTEYCILNYLHKKKFGRFYEPEEEIQR